MSVSSNRPKDIFLTALDLSSPEERAAFLAQACGSDEGLRRRVEAMLQAHAEPDSFLEKPAAALGITIDAPAGHFAEQGQTFDAPGTRIGPYKLLEQIGEGGMGVVYMAEQQEPVRRIVALKIIKPGMDSAQVLARFEAERQALALMDHPNIAKVLDASATSDGRPFFVMELVKGTPITAFCDANKLSLRQRLELFVPVCQAIQHAHQKGVIHRDIKPSNVLIALYDDKPVPKVIDFGIAKATGQALTERTLHTGFGSIVGTPEYMSPEQATFNQLDIDTRSDVYSLGVLLYELMTGSTPVDKTRFKEAALLEVLRVVREDEPPRPSIKLSTTAARASIAAQRGLDPTKLSQLLRGELDWIVMKALEKDRNRRYETAASLGRDLGRFLADEPVEARPASTGYLLRKFVNRHRAGVWMAALVLLAILGGVIGTTAGMLRAWDAESKADQARQHAEASKNQALQEKNRAEENETKAEEAEKKTKKTLNFLSSTVLGVQLEGIFKRAELKDVTLREALIKAEKRIAAEFRDQPLMEARIRKIVGGGLLSLGESAVAKQQLERVYAILKERLGPTDPETVQAMTILAQAAAADDDFPRAVALFEEAIAIQKEVTYPGALTDADLLMELLAEVYELAEWYDDAIRVWRELVAIYRDPETTRNSYTLADAVHRLGRCLVHVGQAAEGEPYLRESVKLYERRRMLKEDWYRFVVVGDLGACLLAQKKYSEAEELLRSSYQELKQREGTDVSKGPLTDHVSEVGERLAELFEATNRADEANKLRMQLSSELKKNKK